MTYEIGHVNEQGDWDSAYGPYVTKELAEQMLERLDTIPNVLWQIREKE